MSSHFSDQVIETGLRNSQDTARSAGVRDLELDIHPWQCQPCATTDPNVVTGWTRIRTAAGRTAWQESNNDETSTIIGCVSSAMFRSQETADTQRMEADRGPRINWIDAIYFNPSTSGSDLDAAPTLALTKQTILVNGGTIATGTTVAVTNSVAASVTKSDTLVRRPRWTVDTPVVMASGERWEVELSVNNSATSDFQFYGFVVGYDFLL